MNNTEVINDPDTVQVSAAEYKAVIEFSVKLAEQNAVTMKRIDALHAEMVSMAETQTATMGAFLDSFKSLIDGIKINVPDQPAPVVNVAVEMPKIARTVQKVRRSETGDIAETVTSYEYEKGKK